MKKLVSVIIPVYNTKEQFEECLKSVIEQKYREIEIIIVDDGSEAEIASWYDSKIVLDNRIRIKHIRNGGVSRARNVGLEIAKGDLCMFVDSDDMIFPDAVSSLVQLVDRADTNVLGCASYTRENPCGYDVSPKVDEIMCTKKEMIAYLSSYKRACNNIHFLNSNTSSFFLSVWGKLYNIDVIKKNNIKFDEDIFLYEDMLFNLKYLNCINNATLSSKIIYYYRDNIESATHQFTMRQYSNVLNVLEKLKKEKMRLIFCNILYLLSADIVRCNPKMQSIYIEKYSEFVNQNESFLRECTSEIKAIESKSERLFVSLLINKKIRTAFFSLRFYSFVKNIHICSLNIRK